MIVYDQRNYDFRLMALTDYAIMVGQHVHNDYPRKNRELLEASMSTIERLFAQSFGFATSHQMRSFATKMSSEVDRQGWDYRSLTPSALIKPYDFYRDMNRNRDWAAAFVNHFLTVINGGEPRTIYRLPEQAGRVDAGLNNVGLTDVVRVPTKPVVASFDPDA